MTGNLDRIDPEALDLVMAGFRPADTSSHSLWRRSLPDNLHMEIEPTRVERPYAVVRLLDDLLDGRVLACERAVDAREARLLGEAMLAFLD